MALAQFDAHYYWRQYRTINPGEFLVAGADCAAGGQDWCATQFISKDKLDVPLVYHRQVVASEMTTDLYPVLNKIADVTGLAPVIAYERNNGGLFEMERLAALNINGKFTVYKMRSAGQEDNPDPKKYGWDTNTATRPKMLSDLKEMVNKRLAQIYDEPTINELYKFVVVKTSSSWKAQAEKGAHDDLVMALAIAWQLYQSEEKPSGEREFMDQLPKQELFHGGFY